MFPTLQIGPIALQVPGLVLILGLWLGLTLAERRALRAGLHPSSLYNLTFLGLLAGVLWGRLAYVLTYPEAFMADPSGLLSLNPGLLDPAAGAACGLIAVLIFGRRKKLSFWPVLDALTPVFAVLAIATSLAHLSAGTAFGAPTDLPWGIHLSGASRHPSQVYETLLGLLILGVVVLLPGRLRFHSPGVFFFTFLALTAAARLFLEAFRGDSTLIFDRFRLAQIIAWVLLAISLWGLGKLSSPNPARSETQS